MKAIVLSYERNFPFMEHMVKSYESIWPKHPFNFVVPCESSPEHWSSVYPGIEFVSAPREIRNCVLSLLADIPDDEWVYWCIDDKFPIKLNVAAAEAVYKFVTTTEDNSNCGISFARSRNLLLEQNLFTHSSLAISEAIKGLRRRYFWQIWYHQFIRAGVLRALFERFPDRDYVAREMDRFIYGMEVPKDQMIYVTEKNYVAFGESTTGGAITKNCAKSMASYGLPIPEGFTVSEETIEMGGKPMFIEKSSLLAGYYVNRIKELFKIRV